MICTYIPTQTYDIPNLPLVNQVTHQQFFFFCNKKLHTKKSQVMCQLIYFERERGPSCYFRWEEVGDLDRCGSRGAWWFCYVNLLFLVFPENCYGESRIGILHSWRMGVGFMDSIISFLLLRLINGLNNRLLSIFSSSF